MRGALSVAMIFSILSLPAKAENPPAEKDLARCNLEAYVADRDPAGTNIRSEPNAGSRVLARLSHLEEQGEDYGAQVTILEIRDGWARIDRAWFADYGSGGRTLFQGRGWIATSLLGFTINTDALKAAPSPKAPIVFAMTGHGWGPDSVTVSRIFDCSGSFARLAVRTPDGRHGTGWANGLCGNQVTTCS